MFIASKLGGIPSTQEVYTRTPPKKKELSNAKTSKSMILEKEWGGTICILAMRWHKSLILISFSTWSSVDIGLVVFWGGTICFHTIC